MIDNYDLWKMHDEKQQRALDELPLCVWCEQPIQQETAVCINDEFYCDDCLRDLRRVVD